MGLSLDMQVRSVQSIGGRGGGGLYWLVELGPIDRNHAC